MKRKYMILVVLALALAVIFFYRTNPERHVNMFVSMYAGQIEESIEKDGMLPDKLGCLETFTWGETKPVLAEFVLSGWGIGSSTRYYGCYYSHDDVPIAFQNTGIPLVQKGHDYWVWQGDGDNHGSTQKIKDHWYYFEASF